MKCPFCHASEVEPDIVHPTLMTCLSCGSMWDPSDYAVDRVVEATNNLRSCIVTLSSGQDITLSYPKDLEPEGDERIQLSWRSLLKQELAVTVMKRFRMDITAITFDDEIEVQRG